MWRRCAGHYFTGQAPELASPARTVVAVGVEGRVNVNQIHAGVGQLGELFQIVAAINDAGVEEGAWAQDGRRARLILFGFWRQARRLSYVGTSLFRHAWRLEQRGGGVNSPEASTVFTSRHGFKRRKPANHKRVSPGVIPA